MSKSFKKIITLGDIYGYNIRIYNSTGTYQPLLYKADQVLDFPFLSAFYNAEYARTRYDMDLFSKYKAFAPAINSFSIAELKDQIEDVDTYTKRFFTYDPDDNSYWIDLVADYLRQSIYGFLSAHSDAYQHIYDALGVEYKPLENYSMTESGSDTYGEDSTSHAYGQDSTTRAYGQDSTTRAYGQDSTSNAYGEQSSSLTTGAQETTTANGIYGYNSTDASNADTQATSAGARTDTSSEAARTDTTTRSEHTDTDTRAEHTDTDTRAEHTDTDTRAEHIDSHSLTRSGNIGVTTSQQMLQSEIDLRKAAVFWDLVTGDIIKSLFYLPDTGVDAI